MLTPIPLDASPVDYFYPTTCDIETSKRGELLAVSLYYNGDTYEVYSTWDDWINRVVQLSKKNKKIRRIWAHNGANFDWQHLAQYCSKERPDISIKFLTSGGTTGISLIMSIRGVRYKIRLSDSYRLLPQGLARLSHDMGVETKKIDLSGIHPEELYKTNPVLFHEYLKHDTISVSQILYKFWHIVNESICINNPARELKGTVASMAMYIFRLEFLKSTIYTPWSKKIKNIERMTYHGGLVLAPNHGIFENCSGVDVNSSFSSIMAKQNLPCDSRVSWVNEYKPNYIGMYYIYYNTYDKDFPYIYDENGKLSISGRAWVTSIELEDIIKNGTAKVIKGFIYRKSDKILKSYAEKIFSLKAQYKKDNPAIYIVAKLLLNALYGKFAQTEISKTLVSANDEKIQHKIDKSKIDRKNGNHGEVIKPIGKYYEVESISYSEYTFVGIASFITAGARLKLINAVRSNRDNALYTDTDSLFVKGSIKNLPIGDKLGEWSLEFQDCELTLLGRKTYAVLGNDKIEKIRAKGVTLQKFRDKQELHNYQIDVINRMKLCATDIYHSELFMFSSPPTNKDVLGGNKKSAVWLDKHRAIRATSDAAMLERNNNSTMSFLSLDTMNTEFKELSQTILTELGGIAPYRDGHNRGEYREIPLYLKRQKGLQPDQIAEELHRNYPHLGIHTEVDLYDTLRRKSIYDMNHRR